MSHSHALPSLPEGLTVQVSTPELIATAAQRRSRGLDYWVDGTMGLHRRGDSTVVIAPNGPHLSRHVVRGNDLGAGLLGGLCEPSFPIEGLPADVDHASGGPLHFDARSGQLLLVYHGERFRDGDPRDYTSFLGLAVSLDDGLRFRDLGPIVTAAAVPVSDSSPAGRAIVEVGSGALVVRDGNFDIYFQDRAILEVRRNLELARAPLDEVVAAAAQGGTPTFAKYSGSGFDQPGLGGHGAELFEPHRSWMSWFDVIYLEPLDMRALVFSTANLGDNSAPEWNHAVVLSDDGLNWTDPIGLLPAPESAEMIYITVDSGGPDQRCSSDGAFDLYRTRATTSFRWDDAQLERVRVCFARG